LKILYFDCFAGISGDMTVGALLDLGVPVDVLREQLAGLPIPRSSYSLGMERTSRKGIQATKFTVHVEEHQPHRHYTDIAGMIEKSSLAEGVKEKAQRIFFRLAEAEAKVHGVEIGSVHFHEVGGIDAIVDIVGTSVCFDYLGVREIHASAIPLGSGYVETVHGKLPVPAPATVELLRGIPVHGELGEGERVTPTGAAIIASLGSSFGRVPSMSISATGCGAGDRDFPDVPNILRVMMGERPGVASPRDELCIAETNVDDMNPEILGFLMERLLAGGALDVTFSPLQMKKNRPGVKVTVLCAPERLESLARIVLVESTSTGVRYYPASRIKMERATEKRETSLGRVAVKVIRDNETVLRVAPEFEECRRIALEKGLPLLEVYRIIERETFAP
jgi:uncharacterized protein (TIGR00299 family) protein